MLYRNHIEPWPPNWGTYWIVTFVYCATPSIYNFMHYIIMLERSLMVSSSSVYLGSKGRVVWKTPSHFSSNFKIVWRHLYLFLKDLWLSLHVCFVNTVLLSAYVTCDLSNATTLRCEVKLVQDEHFWLKSIETFFFFFWKLLIVSLDKTLIPQLGLCSALWSTIETAIWTFNPLKSTIWRKIIRFFFLEVNWSFKPRDLKYHSQTNNWLVKHQSLMSM